MGGERKRGATVRSGPLRHWLAAAAVGAILLIAAAIAARSGSSVALQWVQTAAVLPADGNSRLKLQLRSADGRPLEARAVEITWDEHAGGARLESVRPEDGGLLVTFRAGVVSRPLVIRATLPGHEPAAVRVDVRPALADRFDDGTPDFLRLDSESDRERFSRWFALLAESQAARPPDKLPREVVDCAALVRFAYREALRRHDHTWEMRDAVTPVAGIGDVSKYNYPFTPLGAGLFRVTAGAFVEGDLRSGAFAEFADAETLLRSNTHLVSRDVAQAARGDLLFFYQPAQKMPYHVMIVLGDSSFETAGTAAPWPTTAPPTSGGEIAHSRRRADRGQAVERPVWVVYHTGPSGRSRGEIRRVTMDDLFRHPEPRWHPRVGNPNFLGVYRWNILRR